MSEESEKETNPSSATAAPCPTASQRDQWMVESQVFQIYQLFATIPRNAQNLMLELQRDNHVSKDLRHLNSAFSVLDAKEKKVRRGSSTNKWYGFYSDSSSSSSQHSQTHRYDYEEFKYFLSVNIIGFVYSGLQICDIVKYMITKRHTMDPKLRVYFNFAMDQVLAYLLMSASSSAATTTYYWTNSASAADKYVEMAKASVALSFVAFVAFASSSVVSAFIFCRFN
ncbi:hypothetical protein JHK84_051977 [Glycine max]|nr:hypothetical protein JHK84_051977 [Glycine max]KAH1192467.1 CASP-like protein N24 [Glycine max]